MSTTAVFWLRTCAAWCSLLHTFPDERIVVSLIQLFSWTHSPLGIILCTGKKREQIELLEPDKLGMHVAKYLSTLPPRVVSGSQAVTRASCGVAPLMGLRAPLANFVD